jgi:hypothetical protein
MAFSGYTTNIRVGKIIDGDNAGTWGSLTNTNFDLFDQAVTGYATQAMATTITLTMSDAALCTARNIYLKLTVGTLVAAGTLEVPTNTKLYYIWNNTGYTVTVKTVAGSGIAVSNGDKRVLFCDGTNVIDAITLPTTTGYVAGPVASTDNAVARYDATTGKLIQNSGVIIDDTNNVSGIGTITAATFSGAGGSLTALPAGQLTGSVADARLSANVALYNAATPNFTNPVFSNSVELGYRKVPKSATTSGTLTAAENGKMVPATAGITINDGVFAAGDCVSIYNDSASSITITQDTGMTLRLVGTATTGNRTLAQRGVAVIWFNSATEAVITGVT